MKWRLTALSKRVVAGPEGTTDLAHPCCAGPRSTKKTGRKDC